MNPTTELSEEDEGKLIAEVKCHTLLWNSDSPMYKRIDLKGPLWEKVAAAVKPGLTGEVARKRFLTLKDTYRRNIKKMRESRISMSGADQWKPKWKWFSAMSFLGSASSMDNQPADQPNVQTTVAVSEGSSYYRGEQYIYSIEEESVHSLGLIYTTVEQPSLPDPSQPVPPSVSVQGEISSSLADELQSPAPTPQCEPSDNIDMCDAQTSPPPAQIPKDNYVIDTTVPRNKDIGRLKVKTWTEKDEVALIKALKSRPTLWKYSDPKYRRVDVKDMLWDEVANEIDHPLVDGGEARRKWALLRDVFSRTQRKIERIKFYKPKWKYYQSMRFLLSNPSTVYPDTHENELIVVQTENNDDSQSDLDRDDPLAPSDDDDDNSLIDLWECPSTSTNGSAVQENATANGSSSTSTENKGKKRKLESESQDTTKESPLTTKLMELLALLAKQNRPPPNDRAEHIGQLIAIQLRSLSEEEQSVKICEFMELLYKK